MACRYEATAPTTQRAREQVERAIGSRGRPDEAPFAELEQLVPGAAGYYYDRGALVIVVADSARDGEAGPALMSLVQRGKVRLPKFLGGVPTIRTTRGRYSFSQLAAWRDSAFVAFTSTVHPALVSLGIRASRNRVAIGIAPGTSQALRDDLLHELQRYGVPPAVVVFNEEERGDHAAVASLPKRAAALFVARFPLDWTPLQLIAGHRVRMVEVPGDCSIGAIIRHNGAIGFLTASHCTTERWGADTTHAALYPGGPNIAQEIHDPDDWMCGIHTCRGTDASFFGTTSTTSAVAMRVGVIAKPDSLWGKSYLDDDLWIVTQEEQDNVIENQPVD
ncbi:MAG TPA: hypothetical protein VGD77_05150 [Gemmatimonadaceae bacterium]